MDVIVFQLLRFKTSLRSCWNYIPSFYVPSIFPRCFNVFWKVLNLKNSRASKVERFVKWIFFLRIYIIVYSNYDAQSLLFTRAPITRDSFYIFFYILNREVKEFWKLFFKFKKKKKQNKQTYNILESKLLSIIEKNFTL